ncbi:MAG TPA: hypothetical protein VF584_22935 [Longimicrobium sp.]
MALSDQLRKIAAEQASAIPGEPGYRDIEEFYNEMVRLGIAKQNVYEFPRLDTIGRNLHQKRVAQLSAGQLAPTIVALTFGAERILQARPRMVEGSPTTPLWKQGG